MNNPLPADFNPRTAITWDFLDDDSFLTQHSLVCAASIAEHGFAAHSPICWEY